MSHQVFIERCRDSDPATASALARAIAARYGVDPEQILSRLRAGRFRVKANLELSAAKRFMAYLEGEGALCSIVDGSGAVVERSAEVTPRASTPEEPDDFLPLYTPPPPEGPSGGGAHYESGLAAGFGGHSESQDLGVLSDAAAASSGSFQLSTLDGGGMDAKEGPAATSVADTSNADAFLPPEARAEASLLELAEERPEAPPPEPEESPVQAVSRRTHEPAPESHEDVFDAEQVGAGSSSRRSLGAIVGTFRGRLTLGVLLAFFIGFAVSSFVASGMEDGQYEQSMADLKLAYDSVDSVDAWSELDEVQKTAVSSLERRRRNIVVTSLGIWLVVGGILLFLWMRVINWERIEESLAT